MATLRFSIRSDRCPRDLYGHVGREFKLWTFSAGSILTLRNIIEPLASTTAVERTPRKIQSTKLTPSITEPGKLAIQYYLRYGHITRGVVVLLTFSRLTLSRKSSQFRVSSFEFQVQSTKPDALSFGAATRRGRARY